MQLRLMRDKRARPATARSGRIADHRTATNRAFACAATKTVFTTRTGWAFGLEAALSASEHRVDDDTVADFPCDDVSADFGYNADILVSERKRIRTERFEREGVVGGD